MAPVLLSMEIKFGTPFDIPPYRGFAHPDFPVERIRPYLKTDASFFSSPSTEILHDGRNRIGILPLPGPDAGEGEIVVKEFRPKGFKRLKTCCLPSAARRAWMGSTALLEAGLETPKPLAFIERKKSGIISEAFFLSEKVKDGGEIREIFRSGKHDAVKEILHPLAAFLSRFHEKGILHRDLSDGNILVDRRPGGEVTFSVIDTNRVRCVGKIGKLQAVKNLVRLGIPEDLQAFFLKEYLQESPPRRSLWIWYRLCKKTFSGFIAFKRLLRLRKLAEKLKIQ